MFDVFEKVFYKLGDFLDKRLCNSYITMHQVVQE